MWWFWHIVEKLMKFFILLLCLCLNNHFSFYILLYFVWKQFFLMQKKTFISMKEIICFELIYNIQINVLTIIFINVRLLLINRIN